MRRGTLAFLLVILLLGAGAFYVDFAPVFRWPGIHIGGASGINTDLEVKQGLDLKGGIQFILQAQCPPDKPKCTPQEISQNMPAVVDNISRRVSQGLGVNEATVRQVGDDKILVELPGFKDEQQARDLIGRTGQMNIIDTQGQQLPSGTKVPNDGTSPYKTLFTGKDLDVNSIQAGIDQQSGQPVVSFAFAGPAKEAFAKYTGQNIGKYLTITLDGEVIESATIQSQIVGNGQISPLPSIDQAQQLATLLRYGSLPLPLQTVSEQKLDATLGAQAIEFSMRAAIIGLGIVALFMLIYYRLPGLLADIALVLYALFLFAVIKLLGVTLSLPGIAAVILTVGMAVDANILIFERMKEELRAGRTMASAVDLGFKRAWPSIRDSNASTMITCAILYFFGSNFGATIIVGFSINLFIGVAISLFTAVLVTRNFLNLLVPSGIATHPALYGLSKSALNLPRYRPSQRAGRLAHANAASTANDSSGDAAADGALVGSGATGGATSGAEE